MSEANIKPPLASLASVHLLMWYFDASGWRNNYLTRGTRYLVTKIIMKSLVLFLKYTDIFVDLQQPPAKTILRSFFCAGIVSQKVELQGLIPINQQNEFHTTRGQRS